MVNVPPPLLCSTPPPIDFGEDDDDSGLQSTLHLEDADGDADADEYSAYGLVTESAKVPPLPELPDYNELSNGHCKATPVAAVEAFNYQVKTPEKLPTDKQGEEEEEQHQQQQEQEDEEEEEANTDNLPSLKLDSLSLYSSDSVSPTCTLSPVADDNQSEAPTKAPVLCHQVTLEDVSDDSDEECSPKKPKELFIPEGADDFFAIEIVGTPTQLQQQQATPSSIPIPVAEPDFPAFQETTPVQSLSQEQSAQLEQRLQLENDDDDFGDFADFSEAPAIVKSEPTPPPAAAPASQFTSPADDDDGFDDFQDFVTPTEAAPVVAKEEHDDDDDDDDFGDFSEPTYAPAATPISAAITTPVLPQPPPPAAPQLSITERVKPVLELMFPSQEADTAHANPAKQSPLAEQQSLHFGAIEQAHALDYQWASSEMRHSLVRSLAIDSRNILFGDKWNSAMPRFAANLSYDPLKPLKPVAAAGAVLEPQQLQQQQQQVTNPSWQQTHSIDVQGLESTTATAAANAATIAATTAAASTSQIEAQPGAAYGENAATNGTNSSGSSSITNGAPQPDDATAATSVFAAATAAATLPSALSADGNGHSFDDDEQLPQQQQQHQQLELRGSATPSPPPTPTPAPTPTPTPTPTPSSVSSTAGNSFALPLKETHIYTPSKSDTAVAKTTTLPPIDFDYEIASAGIIIDETVVKKEYRDVEYKPPPFAKPASTEDDDFSDFQSVPVALKQQQQQQQQQLQQQLQPPRNGTPTFGEQMILSPAILLPQTIPLAKPSIEWGDNAQASINADELARIDELFSHQSKPPTISATVAQKPPQQQEDDEWSDFVSVPVSHQQHQPPYQQQQQLQLNNRNNNSVAAVAVAPTSVSAKEDDWSDFVSSNPLPAAAHVARAAGAGAAAVVPQPQFNSGAWQSANFYNNPLSLYQQQQQPHAHSNLVSNTSSSSSNNNNNSNHNNNVPQQIHMMHDFSTAPTATATATYQQQHHQHHQQQLQQQQQQQQQRQQFHLGNAKVAPRISLIPDLSFVAPALPTNAGAFMSSLPKPSFGAKK